MRSRKTKILIVSGVVVLVLLAIGGIFIWKWNNSLNSPSKNSDNPIKKDLTNKIKVDLKERVARVKNGSNDLNDTYPYDAFSDGNYIICRIKGDLGFIKENDKIFPSDIGAENYQEIISLIAQISTEHVKWIEQRQQEAEQKLITDPALFITHSIAIGSKKTWEFIGKERGQKYLVIVPSNHSCFANFSSNPKDHSFQYHRITGVENIPLVPPPLDVSEIKFAKIVKLSDPITIKLLKN